MPSITPTTSTRRRSLLKLGLIGTAALAVGGYVATRITDGSPKPDCRRPRT
jgi:hypothetical protein